MQIINNAYIFYIVRTAIYQWRWWNKFKIPECLKEMNVFINKIDEQFVSKSQLRYGVTERTNELKRSPQTLI